MASTAPLVVPEASSGNPPPVKTTPKSTLLKGFKLEVVRLIGDFISRHGWTSTLKTSQFSSIPQSSSPSRRQPGHNEQPQIPPLSEF